MAILKAARPLASQILARTLPFLGAMKLSIAHAKEPEIKHHKGSSRAAIRAPRPEQRATYFKRKPEYWAAVNGMTNWQNTRWMRAGGIPEHAERYTNMERPSH